MKRAESMFDVLYSVLIWASFLIGVFVQNPWLAGPAAFLILLETLDAR